MADSKLKMVFTCVGGSGKVSYSYKYFDPETTEASVKALVAAMIANGSIFAKPPIEAVSAQMVVTQTTDYDISE